MKSKIYEGSRKILYQTSEENVLTMTFSDKTRIANNQYSEISGKGVINNAISAFIMQKLDAIGIDNHFIKKLNMMEQSIQYAEVIPIKINVSNVACDRYVKDLGMELGYVFDKPIIDYRIKNSDLGYPVVNEHQMINFNWLIQEELKLIKYKAIRIFDFLTGLFAGIKIRMVSCNLEFGRIFNGEEFLIILIDEITPDTCILWDMQTNEKLGADGITEESNAHSVCTYQRILQSLCQ